MRIAPQGEWSRRSEAQPWRFIAAGAELVLTSPGATAAMLTGLWKGNKQPLGHGRQLVREARLGGACRMSSSRVQRGQAQPECGECGAEGLALWHPGRGESMRHRA